MAWGFLIQIACGCAIVKPFSLESSLQFKDQGRVGLALVPAFRSSCYTSAATFHELRKVTGTSKLIVSSAAFLFEFPEPN
jgi:hypothetical protein